jgi:type I restriction enzyme S subunit
VSAVVEARERTNRYPAATEPALKRGFELLTKAPGAMARLRALVLEFATQGRLVRQDRLDEPAALLVQRAQAEKRGKSAGKRGAPPIGKNDLSETALPTGWCWSSLGEVGLISPRNEAADETAATFVQMSSVPVAMMEQHKAETRLWRDIKAGFTHFAEGDVGLAKITPCFENGKSTVFRGLANGIGAGTTELHVVRPLGGVLPEYILIFLKSPGFMRNGEAMMTGSAGQKRVPRTYFEGAPFPLPPLAEQHRIVARVKELMNLCDALERSGRLADEQHARLTSTLFDALATAESTRELAQNWRRVGEHFDLLLDRPEAVVALELTVLHLALRGVLVPQVETDEPAGVLLQRTRAAKKRLVAAGKLKPDRKTPPRYVEPFSIPETWQWAPLSDIATVQDPNPSHRMPRYVDHGIPFVSTENFTIADGIDLSKGKRVTEETLAEQTARFDIPLGSFALSRIGSIGKTRPLPPQRTYCLSHALCVVAPLTPEIDSSWLRQVVSAKSTMSQAHAGVQSIGVPDLGVGIIRGMYIPIPPSAEQDRIVTRVEEVRRLCADLRQRLALARESQSRLADALVAGVT